MLIGTSDSAADLGPPIQLAVDPVEVPDEVITSMYVYYARLIAIATIYPNGNVPREKSFAFSCVMLLSQNFYAIKIALFKY